MEKRNEETNSKNNILKGAQTQAGAPQQSTENPDQSFLKPVLSQPTDPNTTSSVEVLTDKKQSKRWITVAISLFLITALTVVAYFVFKYYQSNQQQPQPTATQLPKTNEIQVDKIIRVGDFSISIPQQWSVSISTKTENIFAARFFPLDDETTFTYLEVQVGPKDDFSSNFTISFDNEETMEEPFTYIVRTGKETLLQSNRKVAQYERVSGNTKILLTLYTNQDLFESLSKDTQAIMEKTGGNKTSGLVKKVWAQEDLTTTIVTSNSATAIAGFPIESWKTIEVMEGPYPERITNDDYVYKDGYAKLFKFSMIRGQRLEILAEESQIETTGSFIETELYDNTGSLVMSAQTRLSNIEQYTDKCTKECYLIVKSFNSKEGPFLLKIFDLDQVNNLYYAHFADGTEMLTNENNSVKSGINQEAVLLIRFVSPIEVIDQNTVRFFQKPDNGCINCKRDLSKDITASISVFIDHIEIPIKITKIFLNQAIIQPLEGEGFPAGTGVGFTLEYGQSSGYGGRFTTY